MTTNQDNERRLMRGGRRGGPRSSLALLLALSLLGTMLSGRAVMAAGPGGGSRAEAGVDRAARSDALPAGLAPVLRRALALRAGAIGLRQGLLEPATTWSQQAELTASDAASGNWFGARVALSGNTALVGASGSPGGITLQGTAYVFVRSGSTWSQQAELTASDGAPHDALGTSHAALIGTTALVGAPGKNSGTGAAYVFVRSGSTWSQQAKLTASDAAANDQFGQAVALSGNTALVGAYGETIGTNSFQGAAYVFVRSGSTWSQQAELTAPATASGGGFGGDVALSGNTALVGANNMTVNGNTFAGAAYLFVRSRANWSQQAELTASDGASGDNFGWGVALSGGTALVGAPFKNSQTGMAYVFVRS